jgi:hypothetical protein
MEVSTSAVNSLAIAAKRACSSERPSACASSAASENPSRPKSRPSKECTGFAE